MSLEFLGSFKKCFSVVEKVLTKFLVQTFQMKVYDKFGINEKWKYILGIRKQNNCKDVQITLF